jgi:alpha-1,6-mannosyltransferase
LKLCDITQFYAPRSGGVKRYLHEKIRFIQTRAEHHQHVLIFPGARNEITTSERSRIYSIASPLASRSSRYRVLLNLRAVSEILERERPDIIESADPYQLGWSTAAIARMLRIPAIAFYHSHFSEAYLQPLAECFGARGTQLVEAAARQYVRELYNRFALTLVSSFALAATLREWGIRNVRAVHLGVDTTVFYANTNTAGTRDSLGLPTASTLLLYVGRLATEKNVPLLLEAFAILDRRRPGEFHLLVIGDGRERARLEQLKRSSAAVTWIPYCADPADLARYYRAADLFVHSGIRETFGLAALESQACGTPVVGIAGSRMDEVILHDQSFWAPEKTPAALAGAIEAAARQDLAAIGLTASHAVREQYAWPHVFEQLFCIYAEVCAEYRRPTE